MRIFWETQDPRTNEERGDNLSYEKSPLKTRKDRPHGGPSPKQGDQYTIEKPARVADGKEKGPQKGGSKSKDVPNGNGLMGRGGSGADLRPLSRPDSRVQAKK